MLSDDGGYAANNEGDHTMKKFRLLQRVTGIHRIHHIHYSFGWKVPFMPIGYFPKDPPVEHHGFRKIRGRGVDYHDCTVTGRY